LNPTTSLIADGNGNLFGTTNLGGANDGGKVFEIAKTAGGYASAPAILASFCALANCADGKNPFAGLIADADGNLFGTTTNGGANGGDTVFETVKTAGGYASTPITLVNFCALANCADGSGPFAGRLIADANGNLFGTTFNGGANNAGTVFEIVKTARGYASAPTILASFCSLPNCADGLNPVAGPIVDANGNLFGTTEGSITEDIIGTAFEITGSGFVVPPIFADTPGKPNCLGKSVSALARQYGGLNAAAAALGYPSVRALQDAILDFCELDHAAEHAPPDRPPEHHQHGQLDQPLPRASS
jgi:uncharacterized repeat protein (TIGR03803 family)